MKILMIDKYHFIKGGAERYLFELTKILENHGHRVIPFSMKHPNNIQTPYAKYFVENIDYHFQSLVHSIFQSFMVCGRMIYSIHARKRLEELIKIAKPDVAHIHMIDHQLSPSILHSLKKYAIPTLQTIHQYKLVCPNYRFYNMRIKKICEKCLDGLYIHPVIERCHKNSVLAGLCLGMEMTIHRITQIYKNNVNLFHVPSQFMGERLRRIGIPNRKIYKQYYTINVQDYMPCYQTDNYLVYAGRLSEEKGILTLLRAMKELKKTDLLIIGDGPQRMELESFVKKHDMQNIKFIGYLDGEPLKSLISRAICMVVPSEWYDNSPLVIYEAFALGTAVIGSKLGGIPELIDENVNGLLFESGNVDELSEKIRYCICHNQKIVEYGKNGRRKAEIEFDPENHYQKMVDQYIHLNR